MADGGALAPPPTLQKSPAETFQASVAAGTRKAGLSWHKTLLLGVIAGSFIALGTMLTLRVGGAMPTIGATNPGLQRLLQGLFGLPTGLFLVLLTGGELFNGNTMLLSTAWLSGRVQGKRVLHNWVWSYAGNLLGCLLVVKMAMLSGLLSGSATAVALATVKVGLGFQAAFWRGVFCNWLVCMAVYVAGGASDLVGKFIAILLPISMFVSLGAENSVANMFLIPLGMHLGAAVTVKQFLIGNLLPVTLGNIFGGAVLVGLTYFLAFGRKAA